MADIRIKDLTTTASSTASDDFIAVDGTTNGTRKLNAFSPTFGGNATVTGTLTVNGGVTTINGNASGTTSYARLQNNGSNISLWGSRAAIDGGTATDVGLFVYGASELSFWTNSTRSAWISSGGVFNTVAGAAIGGTLSVASTTASTTTSTGALVVGNGTSGGLGVGGNITVGGQVDLNAGSAAAPSLKLNGTNNGIYYTGSNIVRIAANATEAATFSATAATVAGTMTAIGTIRCSSTGTANGTTVGPLTTEIGSDGTLGALTVSVGGSPSATGASRFGYIGAGDSQDWRRFIVGSNNTSNGGQVLVPSTLSSTTTSSGALVVSGGVGVAGAIYAGGDITVTKSSGNPKVVASIASGGSAGQFPLFQLEDNRSSGIVYNLESGRTLGAFTIRDSTNAVDRLTITTTLATFDAAIRTSAPSGGTAANWKLGTVATVSPTSPNRTIEVDIGGTIYYIHAKTTNN